MNEPPIAFRWNGMAMVPLRQQTADEKYVKGHVYMMAVNHERSHGTHAHQFAAVHEAWANLPEDLAKMYPTSEHLRKAALIEAGYYDQTIIECASEGAAVALAVFARRDEHAVISLLDSTVVIRTPKSQSRSAMGPGEFRRSKQAVLEIVANLVGAKVDDLTKHAP